MIVQRVIQTFSRQIGVSLLQFLLILIIAREHGADGVGRYALIILVPTLMPQLVSMGIQSSTVYLIGKSSAAPDSALAAHLFYMVLAVPAGMIMGGAIYWAFSMQSDFALPLSISIAGTVAILPVYVTVTMPSLFQATENFHIFNLLVIVQPLVQFMLSICAFLLDAKLEVYVFVFVLSQFCAATTIIVMGIHKFGVKFSHGLPFLLSALPYGAFAHASNIATMLVYRADVVILGLTVAPARVGLYVIAMQIGEKLWLPSQALATVLFPRMANMWNKDTSTIELILLSARITLYATLAFALALALFADTLLSVLFGSEFVEARWALYILLPGIVGWAAARIFGVGLSARGDVRLMFKIVLVVLGTNIVMNFLFIPKLGIEGAALATTLSFGLGLALKSVLLCKREHAVVWAGFVPHRSDLALLRALLSRNKS